MTIPAPGYVVLCLIQILGVCGAVIFAAVEIHSILASGPLFSALGLLVFWGARRQRSRELALFGLSALGATLFFFVLINVAEWGPDHAREPVGLMLLGYEAVVLPLALKGLWQVLSPNPQTAVNWQFSLRSLLALTAVAATSAAAIRVAMDLRVNTLAAVAIGFGAATVSVIAIGGICILRNGLALQPGIRVPERRQP